MIFPLLLAEPLYNPSDSVKRITGRLKVSASFDAAIPKTPMFQLSSFIIMARLFSRSKSDNFSIMSLTTLSHNICLSLFTSSSLSRIPFITFSSHEVNSSTTGVASDSLPNAFMRGAILNITSVDVISFLLSLFAISLAKRTVFPFIISRPAFAIILFSPTSGTISAIVPIAATAA